MAERNAVSYTFLRQAKSLSPSATSADLEKLAAPFVATLELMGEVGRMLRDFRQTLERAGLPRTRFHDLRHTAATPMLAQGVHPKVANEMLGHAAIGITLDLYSHVSPTMQRAAADTIDRLLWG